VKHHVVIESQLFEPGTDHINAHLRWTAETGWQVYVFHRHESQHETHRCPSAFYDRLTYSEAVDALTAEVWELLPFLGGAPDW